MDVVHVCEACFHHGNRDLWDADGTRGTPETVEAPHPAPFDRTIVESPLPDGLRTAIDFSAVGGASEPDWMFLLEDGTVARYRATSEDLEVVARLTLRAEPDHTPWDGHRLTPHLHVSDDGRFIAVVNDYGRWGLVWDVLTGRRTLEVDGGDYHSDTVPLSFSFVRLGHGWGAIHRSDWNRLDVADASTGELLTHRDPPRFVEGKPAPDHYLDYFHGRLLVSPDGRRVADDGWIWHPMGSVVLWSVDPWLNGNPWESEDGASLRTTCQREYYWDQGACWLDSDRLAIGGLGDGFDDVVPGARIFAVGEDDPTSRPRWPQAREVTAFAGPDGDLFSDGDRLFSSNADGLSVWDVEAGARLGRITGFHPTRAHGGAGELAELAGGTLRRWRCR